MSESLHKSNPSKKDSKSEEVAFWRAKKKIAYKHKKEAENTGNGGWVKMLQKRISGYDKKIKSLTENNKMSFLDFINETYYWIDDGRGNRFLANLDVGEDGVIKGKKEITSRSTRGAKGELELGKYSDLYSCLDPKALMVLTDSKDPADLKEMETLPSKQQYIQMLDYLADHNALAGLLNICKNSESKVELLKSATSFIPTQTLNLPFDLYKRTSVGNKNEGTGEVQLKSLFTFDAKAAGPGDVVLLAEGRTIEISVKSIDSRSAGRINKDIINLIKEFKSIIGDNDLSDYGLNQSIIDNILSKNNIAPNISADTIINIKNRILLEIFKEHTPDYFIVYDRSAEGLTQPKFVYNIGTSKIELALVSDTKTSDGALNNLFKIPNISPSGRVGIMYNQDELGKTDLFNYTIKKLFGASK